MSNNNNNMELVEWSLNVDQLLKGKDKIDYFDRKDGSQGAAIRVQTARLRQKDRFGNTHTMWIKQSKEEREYGDKTVYVASGKELLFGDPHPNRKTNNESEPF